MEIGKVYFDRYKIIELIGRGGTSEVYLAENVRLGNLWAIKRAYKDCDNGINLLAEPHILKKLNHPMIPRIIDIEEDEEAVYLIEEFVKGIHLKALKIERKDLEEKDIVDWGLQLCDVLGYLHCDQPHPIIYRDLKPENIILMENGKIKLVDFGIAREYKEEASQDTVPIGTKGYAAPEQYGIGQSDIRTDIFSLGMTLYFLLTGKNLSHSPYKVIFDEQQNISEQLTQIVLKCCAILPNQRYQTVQEVKKELALLLPPVEKLMPMMIETPATVKKVKKEKPGRPFKKTVYIGLLGVSAGCGVTHTAIMLAHYLGRKYRVALIEQNQSKHFYRIGQQIQDEKMEEEMFFSHQKIHYFWGMPLEKFLAKFRDEYEFVLQDFGCYGDVLDIQEFARCDICYVIGQGMDWKIHELERFIEGSRHYDLSNRWRYLVPFLDHKAVKNLSKELEIPFSGVPFQMNPFSVSKEVQQLFDKVLV